MFIIPKSHLNIFLTLARHVFKSATFGKILEDVPLPQENEDGAVIINDVKVTFVFFFFVFVCLGFFVKTSTSPFQF